MANLIIKPATGDGNKLILQDKAGGAVLTTADSGATVANATITAPIIDTIKHTPGSAPGSPAIGQQYYNTTDKVFYIWNGDQWVTSDLISKPKATGGIINTYLDWISHTFITSGTFTPLVSLTVDYLIVAGGGGTPGSNSTPSGGGGAGAYVETRSASMTATAYTIVVGGGGTGGASTVNSKTAGGNSSIAGSGFSTVTMSGGGYGAFDNTAGGAGGSGGGGS